MLRWLGVLVVLAYAALLGVALRQPRRPPPAPPAAQPLTVYYEKDPLPVELCEDWAAKNRVDISQSPLTMSDAGQWPADGDLYIVSPRWLASLQQQLPLRAPADGALARAVNPAFTSQPWDADNERAVPWRWTPYVACQRSDSAPRPATDLARVVRENHTAEAGRWRAFLAGEIQHAILPASYVEKNFTDPRLAEVTVLMPNGDLSGTIIHLDLLAMPADADPGRQRLADDLARHLLAPEQQQRLVTVSGYFPVVTKLGHEFDFAPVPLPREHWFNRSEFLINHPPPADGDR